MSAAAPGRDPLVARLRAGDPDAFAEAVRAHGPRMLATAQRLLRDAHEAEDAVQDAFTSALRAIGRFEETSTLATWLHRITVNAALGRLRARKRAPGTSIDALLPQWTAQGHFAPSPARWDEPETPAEREETRALVRDAIDRLPEPYRTTILLRDVEGLSTAEAAEATGVEEAALKVRLHRARHALRALLDPHFRSR